MLKLVNIEKVYETGSLKFKALKGINIEFPESEFCSILGPSGSGKTTLLNLIGGLDHYTSGDLIINGVSTKEYKDVDWDNYRSKRIGFVFQHYNLINHLSIYENLELSLKINGYTHKERRKRSDEVLKMVGLGDQGNKKPNQLSGGQQQRVAIARSLINNPEIILADEPTGALDSESSVVVMELLKEISKTKLVIMVTHNETLAKEYSTRIIRIKDGMLDKDEVYHDLKEEEEVIENKKAKKSRLGFFTALNMSIKNALTKMFKTLMTCLGCSFGIVGVALVLSLSFGVENYIGRIESQAATMLPITIYSSAVTYEEVDISKLNPQYPDDNLLKPYISPAVSGSSQKINMINDKYLNYLEYIKNEEDLINNYFITRSSSYSYNLTTEFPDGTIKMIDNTASVGSSMLDTITSAVSFPNTPFHQLLGGKEFIEETYELIYGEFPSSDNPYEIVLVVDQYNSIPLTTLQALGIYDSSYTDPIVAAENPISFDDILNKKYKIFFNDELYDVTTRRTVNDAKGYQRVIISGNQKNLTTIFNNDSIGHELEVVGVLRPREGVALPALGTGLCYQISLGEEISSKNDESQISTKGKDNFSLKRYADYNQFRTEFLSYINSIDMSSIMDDLDAAKEIIAQINRIFNKYFDFYSLYNGSVLSNGVSDFINELSIFGIDVNTYRLVTDGLENVVMGMLTAYSEGDVDDFYDDFILVASYFNNYTKIESVVIYPKDLGAKDQILDLLDEYNKISSTPNDPYHATSEEEQVYYTDIVSTFTDSISQMVDVVSIVMVIFSSISLIVSCILTAIITYSSVVERTKEIGILRSLGARKQDVGLLFQAESIMTSTIACIIGFLFSYLCIFPLNYFLNLAYPEYFLGNIAQLTIYHFLILIVVSIVIGFLSGLIPSRIAARKDPVEALGTE